MPDRIFFGSVAGIFTGFVRRKTLAVRMHAGVTMKIDGEVCHKFVF